MAERKNFFWFSEGMFLQRNDFPNRKQNHCEVMINGVWTTYTNWTKTNENNTNWDDIVLIGSVNKNPELRINGVIQ